MWGSPGRLRLKDSDCSAFKTNQICIFLSLKFYVWQSHSLWHNKRPGNSTKGNYMKLASLLKKLESGSHAAHHALSNPPPTHSLRQTNRVTLFFIYLFLHLSQALVETSHCWQVLRVWLHPKLKQPLNACSKTAYFKTTFSLCRVKHCFKSTIFIFLFICSIPLEAWELHGRNVCTSVVFCAFLPSFFLGDGGVWGGGDLESLSQHAVPSQEDKSAHNLPTVTPS